MLVLVEIVQLKTGWEPKIPRKLGFISIVSQNGPVRFGIFELETYSGKLRKMELSRYSPVLCSSIESAKRFPPVLAIAKERMEKEAGPSLAKAEFLDRFQDQLELSLMESKTMPFRFCKSLIGEVGYRSKDEYYWIVSVETATGKVRWVSNDYCIYTDNIATFEVP